MTTNIDFRIGAVLKFSTLDYPGKLSAVVFTQGCPIRCIYCHNPDFQDYNKPVDISIDDVLTFLKTRKGLLDAVVLSGGEPLMQKNLQEAISLIKNKGFLIGLHTAGTFPKKLKEVISSLDWIGFDIKTSFSKYEKITQVPNISELVKESFDTLINSGKNFEIRTTVDSRNIKTDDLIEIAKFLRHNNIKKWYLQECILRHSGKDLNLPLPNQDVLTMLGHYIEIETRRQ